MEPQLPSPISPEQGPRPVAPEQLSTPTPERATPHPEQGETHEQQPAGPSDPPSQQPAVQTPPPLPQITQVPAKDSSAADDTPATAADEDLIEREWVEKAKKVIMETKHDPYLQEQAVSKLQADYLQKRYNKTVKVPNDAS